MTTADPHFFDSRAAHWEAQNYPPAVQAHLRELIPAFGVREGERVLDIGTGPGILIPHLRKRVGSGGRVSSLDLSFEMVRKAREKAGAGRELVLQADVHHLPFRDNSQDRVICFAAFPHFGSPRDAVREMGRVLAPGGVLVIAHLMSRKELARHHGRHATVARDLLPDPEGVRELFLAAALSSPDIVDRPGRYLAVGIKSGSRGPDERSG